MSAHSLLLLAGQRMFAFLQESTLGFYDPSRLIRLLKMDNRPIDVRVQQDCSEFFTTLNEQIEGYRPVFAVYSLLFPVLRSLLVPLSRPPSLFSLSHQLSLSLGVFP